MKTLLASLWLLGSLHCRTHIAAFVPQRAGLTTAPQWLCRSTRSVRHSCPSQAPSVSASVSMMAGFGASTQKDKKPEYLGKKTILKQMKAFARLQGWY